MDSAKIKAYLQQIKKGYQLANLAKKQELQNVSILEAFDSYEKIYQQAKQQPLPAVSGLVELQKIFRKSLNT